MRNIKKIQLKFTIFAAMKNCIYAKACLYRNVSHIDVSVTDKVQTTE